MTPDKIEKHGFDSLLIVITIGPLCSETLHQNRLILCILLEQ